MDETKPPRKRRKIWILLILLALLIGVTVKLIVIPLRKISRDQALISAIKGHNYPTVISLLNQGADPNAQDRSASSQKFWQIFLDQLKGKHNQIVPGQTALSIAIRWTPNQNMPYWEAPENVPIVKALLDHGADPKTRNRRGTTVTYTALLARKMQTFHLLLERGAEIKGPENSNGETLLMPAIFNGDAQTVVFLLNRGVDVNAQDNVKLSPLIYAAGNGEVGNGEVQIVRILLAHHANFRLRDKDGKTALVVVKECLAEARKYRQAQGVGNYIEIIRLLQEAGEAD